MRPAALIVALGALLVGHAESSADVSKAVQKAFRGTILLTAEALPDDFGGDKETIAAYKKAAAAPIPRADAEGSASWNIHFLAFMKSKPSAQAVSVDFYTRDKKPLFVAQKRLTGVDPNLTVLRGNIQVSEDDGLTPGKSYDVKLAAEVKGREVILATARFAAR